MHAALKRRKASWLLRAAATSASLPPALQFSAPRTARETVEDGTLYAREGMIANERIDSRLDVARPWPLADAKATRHAQYGAIGRAEWIESCRFSRRGGGTVRAGKNAAAAVDGEATVYEGLAR